MLKLHQPPAPGQVAMLLLLQKVIPPTSLRKTTRIFSKLSDLQRMGAAAALATPVEALEGVFYRTRAQQAVTAARNIPAQHRASGGRIRYTTGQSRPAAQRSTGCGIADAFATAYANGKHVGLKHANGSKVGRRLRWNLL